MSPGQGEVTHTLTNNGTPYNSNSTYEGSGSWTYITAEQGIPAKAEWGFNYVAKATGASIMTSVSNNMV